MYVFVSIMRDIYSREVEICDFTDSYVFVSIIRDISLERSYSFALRKLGLHDEQSFWIREFNSNYRFLRFLPYASVSDFKGHRNDFRDEGINYTPKSLKSLWGHPERQQRHLLCCFSFCKQQMVLFFFSYCCFINRKTASKGSVARPKRF